MSKKRRRAYREPTAADGGTLTRCYGCQFWPLSSKWLEACPRCGMLVCRVCAHDKPHRLSESATCALPEGQAPKDWGLRDPGAPNRFDHPAVPC